MKSFKFFLMSVAVLLFAAGACNKTEEEETTTTPEIEVDSTEVEVKALGGTVSIEYSVTDAVEGETLTATSDSTSTWLSAIVGEETIDITIEENTTKEDRSATVTLSYSEASDVTITVTQVIPIIEVDSEVSVDFIPGETTVSFSVTNAVEGDEVTATVESNAESWLDASVNNETFEVTLSINGSKEQASRCATVTLSSTYARDVEFSVIQARAPYPAEYGDFLGTWVVTDMLYGLSATIEIEENVNDDSYTIKGWQFSEDLSLSDMGVLGLDGITNSFPAYYKAETKSLDVLIYNFGTGTYQNYSGTMYLAGTIYFGGNDTYGEGTYIITSSTETYTIASMTLDDLSTGKLTGGTVDVQKLEGSFDVIRMSYAFITNDDTVYTWDNEDHGIYLPCTLTKLVDTGTASTSSVKSREKVVPVKSEMKVVEL